MNDRDALHLEIVEALLTEGTWISPLVLGESTRVVHNGGQSVILLHNTEMGRNVFDLPLCYVAEQVLRMRAAAKGGAS